MTQRIAVIGRLCFASLVIIGCGDAGTGVTPPASLDALVVALENGDGQEGIVGEELPLPLTVHVTDTLGRNVEGQLVNFVVTSGQGTVFASSALTDGEGRARDFWTLGTSIFDEQVVEVRAVNSSTGEKRVFGTFTAVPKAGPPVQYIEHRPGYESHSIYSATGLVFRDTLGVKALDTYNNPVAGISVEYGILEGGGSLAEAVVTTNDSGFAKVEGWTFGPPGEQRLSVDVPGVGANGPTELVAVAYPTEGRSLTTPAADQTASAGTPVHFLLQVQGSATGDIYDIYALDVDDPDTGDLLSFRQDVRETIQLTWNAPPAGQVIRRRVSIYGIGALVFTLTGT